VGEAEAGLHLRLNLNTNHPTVSLDSLSSGFTGSM
jgi:hypothetical protein